MTVSSQTSNETFFGNGVTTVWDLPFRFFANGDIQASLIDTVTGATIPLVLGTDYTLTGAGLPEQFGTAPGKITTTVAVPSGRNLYVERIMDVEQLTDILNQGEFFPEVHEDVFDRLTMLIQQNASGLSRALLKPPGKEYYDAKGLNISNVKDPVEHQDAATGLWVKNYLASLISTGQGPFNNAANVLYAAPGGVTRTVKDRLDEEVSLKDFGAVGDGIIDDTVAIQAAIDSDLPLWGPIGDYVLTDEIIITKPLKLRGAGWKTRFIHRGDYGDTFRIADPLNAATINGVFLTDFQIAQDTTVPVSSGAQLRIDGCRDVWLTNVFIRNGWIGYANVGSDQVHINGLYVLFDNTNGGNIAGRRYIQVLPTTNTGKAAHPGDVFIVNSNFRSGSTPACGVGFEMTAGDGIWLANSHIGNCISQNLRVDANNITKCTGLLLDNVWLDIGTGESIKFQGSVPTINGNHYIRNCKLLGGGSCTHGIDIDGAANRIRVENTEISDMLNNGIWTRPTSTGEVSVDGTIIRDCSQAGAGVSNGFTYGGTGNTYFTNNRVLGNLYNQHINITGAKNIAVLDDNVLVGSFTGSARMSTLTGTQISQKDNHGFNATGNEGIAVGPSPWVYNNAFGYPLQITIGGGTVTSIAIAGVGAFGLTSGTFILAPGQNLTVTYTVAPAARAWGL